MAYIERPRFSCALGGALETITSLPGVAPVIHASAGCGANLFGSQQAGGTYGAGYCGGLSASSSNVTENEIIFGGEDRLKEQIATTLEIIDAELYIVVTSCMTEIIGDDTKAVANYFRENNKPVFAVSTGGFKGNSYKGYDLVLETLFTEYVPKAPKNNKLVNIWGAVPSKDAFFRGDLAEIKRLLGLVGVEANTFFTYDETLENLKSAGSAAINIVLSKVYGLEAAKAFENKHGTPFITKEIPIGDKATTEFLYEIAELLKLEKQLVEKVIKDEKRQYYKYIERILDTYLDGDLQHYAIVVANSNYSYSINRFLVQDLGWLPELSIVTDVLKDEEKAEIKCKYEELNKIKTIQLEFITDTAEIIKLYTKERKIYSIDKYPHLYSPLFVFGSTHEIDLANRLGAKALSVSFPIIDRAVLDRGYAGFRGGLHLFEDILDVILARR
ncbi:MAG: nitrogenase component 1 [Ruminiclostridium sp.]